MAIIKSYKFSSSSVNLHFDSTFAELRRLTNISSSIIITDENIYAAHTKKFNGWNTIIIKAGEEYKSQETVNSIIDSLIEMQADRTTTLVGVGGGVITDLTGYIASVYMRGIRFGFVPTTILGLVDASIGGKNGIDVGQYKNMVGTIKQPAFILHDLSFLKTLPNEEWQNGFAEIIKHACIGNAAMFAELEKTGLHGYQRDKKILSVLIQKNAILKIQTVQKDEFESGPRRLLNFGHTLGHALEMHYEMKHGQAVSIGMIAACRISEKKKGFSQTARVTALVEKYGLPAGAEFDPEVVFQTLSMDKKREKKSIHYILLEKIGRAVIENIPLNQLQKIISKLN